jgi:hypothetical protein
MKRVVIFITLAAVVLFMPAVAFAQKLVFVVRHAERADAGMQAHTDPPLSAAGEVRAHRRLKLLPSNCLQGFKRRSHTTLS